MQTFKGLVEGLRSLKTSACSNRRLKREAGVIYTVTNTCSPGLCLHLKGVTFSVFTQSVNKTQTLLALHCWVSSRGETSPAEKSEEERTFIFSWVFRTSEDQPPSQAFLGELVFRFSPQLYFMLGSCNLLVMLLF